MRFNLHTWDVQTCAKAARAPGVMADADAPLRLSVSALEALVPSLAKLISSFWACLESSGRLESDSIHAVFVMLGEHCAGVWY